MTGLGGTGTVVIDASALAAVLFAEPEAEELADQLGDRELLAPTLLPYELASVGVKKAQRYPAQRDAILEALGLFSRLGIRQVEIPPQRIADLAARETLTAYDAAYLWLARKLDCELVTLDRKLANAARS